MSDPLAEIKATFFQECEEQLAELETGLMSMEEGDEGAETVNAVFRAVHSIKGGAGAFGLDALVRFSHAFENTLDDIRAGRLQPDANVLKTLLRAADMLADQVRAAREGGGVDEVRSEAIVAELKGFSGGGDEAVMADDAPADDFDIDFTPVQFAVEIEEPAPASTASSAWTIRLKPHASLYTSANEVALLLRELGRLGEVAVELDASALPPLDSLGPGKRLSGLDRPPDHRQGRGGDPRGLRVRRGRLRPQHRPGGCGSRRGGGRGAVRRRGYQRPAGATDAGGRRRGRARARSSHGRSGPRAGDPDPCRSRFHRHARAHRHAGAGRRGPSQAGADKGAGPAPSIRVDLDRVDRLIDLVGELVINQAMLAQRVSEAGMAKASNIAVALEELEHLTRDIQDSVMAIRAQPVKSVFQRMPRLVRETAAMVNKQVRLVTEGEQTEVDKTVIEKLADPLTHMIRNAIDHGLESTEERLAAGKPAEGSVRLAALHRSGRIVIEIADDGKGIDRARVRGKAVEKGLIAPDANLTDEEVDNLIFAPGFSTAAAVSDISGRGVGMDVVKRSIQALGGRISIASRPGEGSTFTMSLPLTLAVLDGMVVSVAGQTFVAPLTAIVETLQPRPSEMRTLGAGNQLLTVREAYVPLIDVGVALGYREQGLAPTDGVVLLIEREDGVRTALLVDDILGQRQVVIKSLEANYRQVEGVAAATILGDGRVALILDIDALAAWRAPPARPEPRLAAVG